MKCPYHKDNPPAWVLIDEEEEVWGYAIQNPLGECETKYVSMPINTSFGLPMIKYTKHLPEGSTKLTCPIESDEAHVRVARAVSHSAIGFGYYPDTSKPIVAQDEDEGL